MNRIKKAIKAAVPVAAFTAPFLALAIAPIVIPTPLETGAVTLTKVGDIINEIANYLIIAGVTIGVIFIIYGGLRYMTARDDPAAAKKALDNVKHGFIGVVIVVGVGILIRTAGYIVNSLSGGSLSGGAL